MGTSLLALWLLAAPPAVEDPAFLEGQELYRQLEFEKATIAFQKVALDPGLSPEEQARVLTWVALCYAQLGDFDGARESLAQAVLRDRDVELAPDAPPKVRALLDEVIQSAPAGGDAAAVDVDDLSAAAAPEPHAEATRDAAREGATSTSEITAPTSEPAGPAVAPLVGYVVAGTGAVGVAAGAVLLGLSLYNGLRSYDRTVYQADAAALADTANAQMAAAGGVTALGVVLLGTGLTVAVLSQPE